MKERLALNHVVLSGWIVADPQRSTSTAGAPITVLIVSFAAAEERMRREATRFEVEVPDELADEDREALRLGMPILVSGELSGAGSIWAKLLTVGEAS